MTWGWDSRGSMSVEAGGNKGTVNESKTGHAWPRYEAEYLKEVLQSDAHKYNTDGLSETEKSLYLDKITSNYKAEADERLHDEFMQWLQGQHEANDASKDQVYINEEGKPVRKWVARDKEAMDADGNYKVGQARAGWKHTPWGRQPLTHLPGVKEYFRAQAQRAHDNDTRMQLLAEFGPQNLEQAWMYFKHWVKGRPFSDALLKEEKYLQGERTLFDVTPDREYDTVMPDRQPGVRATDPGAQEAAVGKEALTTTPKESQKVQEVRDMRQRLEQLVNDGPAPSAPKKEYEQAIKEDQARAEQEEVERVAVAQTQRLRQADASAPLF